MRRLPGKTLIAGVLAAVAGLAGVGWAQTTGESVRFRKVFTALVAPAASDPLPNIGQGLHLFAVFFPKAGADVTGFSVRVEASFDNLVYVPISLDTTTARWNGTTTFAIQRANGVFPYVRLRVVAVPPGPAEPMDVWYTGGVQPIGNVFFATDRYLASGPSAAYDKVTFGICNGSPCAVGADLTPHYIVTAGVTVSKCWITAKTPPVGADLIVDMLRNGTTSFFGATKLVLPAGSGGIATQTTFGAGNRLNDGDYVRVDILQVGSLTAGQDVSAVCKLDF